MTAQLRTKLYMHAKLHKGGYMYIYEAVDFPGVLIADKRETRQHPVTRTITYNEQEYPTLAAAIDAFKADLPQAPNLTFDSTNLRSKK